MTTDAGPFAYLPSGWLLWGKAGTLLAQRLDADKAALVGEPEPLAEGAGEVSVATTGLVAYRSPASSTRQLVWRNRTGAELGVVGEPDPSYYGPKVSPDGRRVSVSRTAQGAANIWLLDQTHSNRITFNGTGGADLYPDWSPDGTHIAFTSKQGSHFDLYQKFSSGEGEQELLLKTDLTTVPTSWSTDGRYLLYFSINPSTRTDIWVLPMTGERKPIAFLKTKFEEGWGQFSPDGKWVAYKSRESGRYEVFVRPFIEPGADNATPATSTGQWQVSTAGGIIPMWSANGKELFFVNPDGRDDGRARRRERNRTDARRCP